MDEQKKMLLKEQVSKLEEILHTLESNFDLGNELTDEYSFLSIVKENLEDFVSRC